MWHLRFSYWPINIKSPIFRHRVSEAAKLGVNVFKTIVYGYFETAINNAVTTEWPGCEVKARRFHLGQIWWRKMRSLGLSKQHGKKDSEVSQFLKKIFGLSLLPPAEVSDCFALDFTSSLPDDKRVEQLCDLLLLFSSLSDDRSKASSKTIPPHIAIQSLLLQMRVSSFVCRSSSSFLHLLPCQFYLPFYISFNNLF